MHTEECSATNIQTPQELLINILRAEVCGNIADAPNSGELLDQDTAAALYALSKKHDLAHIISSYLSKHSIVTDEGILAQFKREEITSIYRCEQIKYAYKQICGAFDAAAIPYIPLKGSVIRPYYPKESMRTSCDIDILVKEEDLYRSIDILVKKGYECGEKNYHDISLRSPNKVNVELHFNIQENIEKLDCVLKEAWRHAVIKDGYHYEFTKEFFVFHMFAHMSYHFLSGGCGIRSLMDIWIMEQKMGVTFEESKEFLARAEIYKFASEISRLANSCFSDIPMNAFSHTLLKYILDGNLFGTQENSVAMGEKQTYTSIRYILKRIFIPYNALVLEYRVLKKCFLLYPFCWLHRSSKLFIRTTKRIISRKKARSMVAEDKISNVQQLRSKLGI